MNTKNEIREHFLNLRKVLDDQLVKDYSEIICQKIIMMLEDEDFDHVGIYNALGKEVDTSPIIEWCKNENIEVYFPLMDEDKQEIIRFQSQNGNIKNDLDMIIVPLVAFDQHLNRLGRGKGHFDKFLNSLEHKVFLVGLAYEQQYYNKILPIEEHDKSLNLVVTENQSYWLTEN